MVLDLESRPNWKLCCNQCNKIIRFTTSIHEIQVLKKRCEECGSSLVKIDFNILFLRFGDFIVYNRIDDTISAYILA